MADLAPIAQMAACKNTLPDSASPGESRHDPARVIRPRTLTEESGDHAHVGSFSGRAGSGAALRRQFLLHGVPIRAAPGSGA